MSRIKTEFRVLSTAIRDYEIDHGAAPLRLDALTTPVAYLDRLPRRKRNDYPMRYEVRDEHWFLISTGPDGVFQIDEATTTSLYPFLIYDPTNGVVSAGDYIRFDGGPLEPRHAPALAEPRSNLLRGGGGSQAEAE